MKRDKIIHALQFTLVWVWVRAFVVFVLEWSFIEFFLKYWLFLLIASVSYFYYYSIQYETDKKYNFIRNAIIVCNVYLFAHIFFRPLLNISHELFILLGLIILWLWGTTKIKSKGKVVLQIVGWILSFAILISGIFYLYPEAPDINWFLKTQDTTISFLWVDGSIAKKDAYVQIVSDKGKKEDFSIEWSFNKILSEDCRILYPSLQTDRLEKIVISNPDGWFLLVLPQTEVQLKFSWWFIKGVYNVSWRIWVLSWVLDIGVVFSWHKYDLSDDELDLLDGLQDAYKLKLVSYLKKQISGDEISLVNTSIMYSVNGTILKFLVKMFPASFSKNLRNYNKFQEYFSLVPSDEYKNYTTSLQRGNQLDVDSFFWDLRDNMEIWHENMYLNW